jgi:hypothetical protein
VNCLIKKFLNKNEFNLFEYLWNYIKFFRTGNICISIKLKLKRFCFSTRWVTVSDQGTVLVRSTSSCEKNWELSQDHFQRDFVRKLKSLVHFNRNILRLSEKICFIKIKEKIFQKETEIFELIENIILYKIFFPIQFNLQNNLYEFESSLQKLFTKFLL